MKMSEVDFRIRETEQTPNIEATLSAVGSGTVNAINHAINCHDELVEALELALSAIELYAVDLKLPSDTIGQNRLRAALAKAKG